MLGKTKMFTAAGLNDLAAHMVGMIRRSKDGYAESRVAISLFCDGVSMADYAIVLRGIMAECHMEDTRIVYGAAEVKPVTVGEVVAEVVTAAENEAAALETVAETVDGNGEVVEVSEAAGEFNLCPNCGTELFDGEACLCREIAAEEVAAVLVGAAE